MLRGAQFRGAMQARSVFGGDSFYYGFPLFCLLFWLFFCCFSLLARFIPLLQFFLFEEGKGKMGKEGKHFQKCRCCVKWICGWKFGGSVKGCVKWVVS